MRYVAPTLTAAFSLALAGWPTLAAAQNDRDYVFTDDQGHLVLRYAGAGPGGLTHDQMDEIVNVQLSTMVHDRLRADAVFEAEPIDPAWAKPMQARLAEALTTALPEMSALHAECRSASCRLLLEHSDGHTVAAHQSLMDTAQRAIRAFLAAHPGQFEHVFLMAGHYKEPGGAYIKVFLRRTHGKESADGG
jgi:hypothetical protein